MLLNCEICLHEERRGRIPYRFTRWRDYQEHMRDVHGLLVTRDGEHTQAVTPKRHDLDEL